MASSTSGAASHLAWRETEAAAEEVIFDDDDDEIADAPSLFESNRTSVRNIAVVAVAAAVIAADFNRHAGGRGGRDEAIAFLFPRFPQRENPKGGKQDLTEKREVREGEKITN